MLRRGRRLRRPAGLCPVSRAVVNARPYENHHPKPPCVKGGAPQGRISSARLAPLASYALRARMHSTSQKSIAAARIFGVSWIKGGCPQGRGDTTTQLLTVNC